MVRTVKNSTFLVRLSRSLDILMFTSSFSANCFSSLTFSLVRRSTSLSMVPISAMMAWDEESKTNEKKAISNGNVDGEAERGTDLGTDAEELGKVEKI